MRLFAECLQSQYNRYTDSLFDQRYTDTNIDQLEQTFVLLFPGVHKYFSSFFNTFESFLLFSRSSDLAKWSVWHQGPKLSLCLFYFTHLWLYWIDWDGFRCTMFNPSRANIGWYSPTQFQLHCLLSENITQCWQTLDFFWLTIKMFMLESFLRFFKIEFCTFYSLQM